MLASSIKSLEPIALLCATGVPDSFELFTAATEEELGHILEALDVRLEVTTSDVDAIATTPYGLVAVKGDLCVSAGPPLRAFFRPSAIARGAGGPRGLAQ